MAEYIEYEWNLQQNQEELKPAPRQQLTKPQALQAIREMIPSRPDVGFICTDDAFLMRFLNARKFDVKASFNLLVNYFLYRQRHRHLFIGLNSRDPLISKALFDGFPGILPKSDARGRRILVFYSSHWDVSQYSLLTIYRALLLSLEKLVDDPITQLSGLIIIVDWSGFTFRHSSALSPRALKLILDGLQDCFPARFKGIHMVGQPWYLDAALSVIKPFLKEKTRNKIFLHGNNLSKLHTHIDKQLLPAELGGEGPSYHAALWAQELLGTNADLYVAKEDEDDLISTVRKSETFPDDLLRKNKVEESQIDLFTGNDEHESMA